MLNFTKMQGAANDFVVVDARDMERDWMKLAVAVCDRHLGIGADGLILLCPSDRADFRMRIFNADGSEAEMCGNGIRCLTRYAMENGIITSDVNEITVETMTTVNRITLEREGGRVTRFFASIGRPKFIADEIPVNVKSGEGLVDINGMLNYKVSVGETDLALNLVSMGNPHAVHFIETPTADFPLHIVGPRVERLPVFPGRTNFEVARVLDDKQIEARVWERGVGETLACGSGACAVGVASKLLGYTGAEVDIKLPGGMLNVVWNGEDEVVLGGPAETVFKGIWPD